MESKNIAVFMVKSTYVILEIVRRIYTVPCELILATDMFLLFIFVLTSKERLLI